MTSFSLIHLVIDYVHLMHEIDSFKLPKENIDALLNMILLLELIVLMAGAVSNGFTKRMLYSLDFKQFAKFAGSKPCFIHTWLGSCFFNTQKKDLSLESA